MSHCYWSDGCYGKPNKHCPPCEFVVVVVATQPRFHHIQILNEVTTGRGCSVQNSWSNVEVCAWSILLLQQNVCIFTVVMKVSDE